MFRSHPPLDPHHHGLLTHSADPRVQRPPPNLQSQATLRSFKPTTCEGGAVAHFTVKETKP